MLPRTEQPEPTALLVPGGFVGPAAGRGTAALLEQSSSKKKKTKNSQDFVFQQSHFKYLFPSSWLKLSRKVTKFLKNSSK